MVGGRDWWGDARFGRVNLATGAGGGGRPAGSAFKAFALVAALERGIPPEAVFAAPDRLVVGRARRGPDWRVANYEGHGFGKATLRTATALSINTVYAGLLLRLGGGDADRGARAVVEAAARMGVGSPLRAVPSAVLGTGEVTPLEMAAAYATLAAKGRRAAPFGVARITGADGRVLYQARPDGRPGGQAGRGRDRRRRAPRGGRPRHRRAGPDRAAGGRQDGTTQDHADAWFVGFTPSLATAVWVGYPQGQVPMVPPRTGGRVSGGTWPAAIWSGFMRAALAGSRTAGSRGPTCAWSSWPWTWAGLPAEPVHAGGRGRLGRLPEGVGADPDLPGAAAAAGGGGPGAGRGAGGRAAGWLEEAGLSLVQRLAVDDAAAPGTVLAQSPAGGAARPAGAPVELTVAVDAQGAGGLGLTLVPEVLGQPEETARHLLDQAGLTPRCRPPATPTPPGPPPSPAASGAPAPPPAPRPPPAPGSASGSTPRAAHPRHDHHPRGTDPDEHRRALAAPTRPSSPAPC